MTFNYNTKKIQLKFLNDITVDSIEFSDEERQRIESSFVKNHIDTITGMQSYGDNKVFPAFDLFRFYIYENNRQKAEIFYFSDAQPASTDSRKVGEFTALVVGIIEEKTVYKEMIKKSLEKQEIYEKHIF